MVAVKSLVQEEFVWDMKIYINQAFGHILYWSALDPQCLGAVVDLRGNISAGQCTWNYLDESQSSIEPGLICEIRTKSPDLPFKYVKSGLKVRIYHSLEWEIIHAQFIWLMHMLKENCPLKSLNSSPMGKTWKVPLNVRIYHSMSNLPFRISEVIIRPILSQGIQIHCLLVRLRTLLLNAILKSGNIGAVVGCFSGPHMGGGHYLRKNWVNETLLASALKLIGVTVDPMLVKAICGIWDTNAFEIYVGPEHKYAAQALFPLVSMMNHSCVANVQTNFRDGFMYIRAATPIKKGEPIALNYRHMLWGTRNRRRYLLLTKLFMCQCPRCMDPTELNSHVSSIRCQKCKKGLYVPYPDHSKPWECNNCPSSMPARLADTMTGASETKCAQVDSTSALDIKNKLLLFQEGLGPQHFICVELRRLMVLALTTQPTQDMSSSDLWLVVDLTSDMLKLAKILEPGMSDFRGQMLLQHVRAATELIFRAYSKAKDVSEVGQESVAEEGNAENEKKESSLSEGIEVDNVNKLESQELLKQSEEFQTILKYDPSFGKAEEVATHLKKVIEQSNLTEILRA
ncbi:unnamed protein product, partial [Meganyctiphanes norvegica]